MKKSSTTEKGFTLIETLVAVSVFAFLVAAVGSVYVQVLQMQRRASAAQKIQSNALFIFDRMSREIRYNTVHTGECATDTLTLRSPDPASAAAIVYAFDADRGVITRSEDGGAPQDITTSDVTVVKLAFICIGAGVDGHQIRVTVPVTFQAGGPRPGDIITVSLQTTMSSRLLFEQ